MLTYRQNLLQKIIKKAISQLIFKVSCEIAPIFMYFYLINSNKDFHLRIFLLLKYTIILQSFRF